jgi:hypothetical protein
MKKACVTLALFALLTASASSGEVHPEPRLNGYWVYLVGVVTKGPHDWCFYGWRIPGGWAVHHAKLVTPGAGNDERVCPARVLETGFDQLPDSVT